jgi:hypothetical protein
MELTHTHALELHLQVSRAALSQVCFTKYDRTSDQDSCGTAWKAVPLKHGMRGSRCNLFCWSFSTGEPDAPSFSDFIDFAVLTLPSIPTAKAS